MVFCNALMLFITLSNSSMAETRGLYCLSGSSSTSVRVLGMSGCLSQKAISIFMYAIDLVFNLLLLRIKKMTVCFWALVGFVGAEADYFCY
ncbi:hypothetical protein LguiA_026263 [Lonicera macranthoides]